MIRWLARVAAAASLFAAAAAQAENWWYVTHNEQHLILVDADSIEGTGDRRTGRLRMYPVAAGGFPHVGGSRIEADCSGNRVRYLDMAAYTDAMAVIEQGAPPAGYREWRQLAPSNHGALVVRFACGEREAADWRPVRIGALRGRADDPPLLKALVRDGVPEPLAALFGLGAPSRAEAEAWLADVPAEVGATLRRHGFPR